LAQGVRMRSPALAAVDWLPSQTCLLVPGLREVASSCCTLIQPICTERTVLQSVE